MKSRAWRWAWAGCVGWASGAALAQEREAGAASPASGPPGWNARFNAWGSHALASEFSDGPGEFSTTRGGFSLDAVKPLSEHARLIISGMGERSRYDFSEATGFPGGGDGPWESTTELSLGAAYRARIDERWGYLVGGGANAAWEDGAEIGESLTFGARGGVTYSSSPTATIGLGLAVGTRLEDSVYVVPFPILEYQFAEKWSLSTGGGGASRGFQAVLGYQVSEAWSVALAGGFEGREFRLDDSGPVAGGVGTDLAAPVGLIVTWKQGPQLTVRATAGVNVYRQLTVDDANGDEVAQDESDAGFFAGLNVELGF